MRAEPVPLCCWHACLTCSYNVAMIHHILCTLCSHVVVRGSCTHMHRQLLLADGTLSAILHMRWLCSLCTDCPVSCNGFRSVSALALQATPDISFENVELEAVPALLYMQTQAWCAATVSLYNFKACATARLHWQVRLFKLSTSSPGSVKRLQMSALWPMILNCYQYSVWSV